MFARTPEELAESLGCTWVHAIGTETHQLLLAAPPRLFGSEPVESSAARKEFQQNQRGECSWREAAPHCHQSSCESALDVHTAKPVARGCCRHRLRSVKPRRVPLENSLATSAAISFACVPLRPFRAASREWCTARARPVDPRSMTRVTAGWSAALSEGVGVSVQARFEQLDTCRVAFDPGHLQRGDAL